DPALEPGSLDVGEVADDATDGHPARRARRPPSLLVGQALGLAGHDRPLVVEELDQRRALVGRRRRVGRQCGHFLIERSYMRTASGAHTTTMPTTHNIV